jgi:hypothetical protein
MKNLILSVLIIVGTMDAFGQGFVNLDFESPNLSGYSYGPVPTTNAIPGWTAYFGGTFIGGDTYQVGTNVTEIGYTNIPDVMGVNLLTNYGGFGIYGYYVVLLKGTMNDGASIGQTGTIPATAQSLIFDGIFGGQVREAFVSFNGQNVPYTLLGQSGSAFIYGADISAYAGQTGQLLFTSFGAAYGGDSYILDNIQFSSSPVPEPSPSWLLLLGSGALIYGRTRKRYATQAKSAR